MRSTFGGLEIAKRSLGSHQLALQITGHNIANANAPGYSRQKVSLRATSPYTVPGMNNPAGPGQVGTGVEPGAIQRMVDQFVQAEINKEARNTGYWTSRDQMLRQIEAALMEPSDTGVRAAFDQFWESLQELQKNPESHAVRSVVAERATVLAETIHYTRSQLLPIQKELDHSIQGIAQQVTSLGEQIAVLNQEIARAKAVGYEPNDLLDRRDQLVEEVSELSGATVVARQNGMIAVLIGGTTLVDGAHSRELIARPDPNRSNLHQLVWGDSGSSAIVNSGQLASYLDGRDDFIPELLRQIDLLAATLIEKTNEIHASGIGLNGSSGLDFFVGNDAMDIAVNPMILSDVANIAASATGDAGDGSIALRLAQMNQEPVMEGKATFEEYFSAIVSNIGVSGQKAARMVEHQSNVENHLLTLRESASGVNLDEEMTNMIMYQHAYAAASRVVTVMDEALETIISRMGLVGR